MEDLIIEPSIDLLESMRSVGYSLEAAVADIVDNSIDAAASRIDIDVDVVLGNHVALLDDGHGMSEQVAIEALRLAGGAGNNAVPRLGRFGLGMKTASLSQGRCLTVVSKRGTRIIALRWDIDHVLATRKWSLIRLGEDEIATFPFVDRLLKQETGTVIIWTRLDLLLGDAVNPGEFLQRRVRPITEHLSLTFHRFLARAQQRLQINVNGVAVTALDPFLRSNPSTQESPTEEIPIGKSSVRFTAFTLPHASRMSAKEKSRPDMSDRMREHQGFYLYRNERLLSRGQWFGLASMSELTKQTRVKVDVPQELDDLWQIDIKKSRAEPPSSFKTHLKRMIEPLLDKGVRVHRFRGRKPSVNEISHVWDKYLDREGFRYEINLENPLIAATLSSLVGDQAKSISSLFQLIAEQFPYLDAYQEIAGNKSPAVPERGSDEIVDRLVEIRDANLFAGTSNQIYLALKVTEPFDSFDHLETLIDEVWGTDDSTQ